MAIPLRIGGADRPIHEIATIRSPWDGEVVGEIALADEQDIEAAIATADATFATFKKSPRHVRAAILERAAVLLSERAERVAATLVRESGKPLLFARAEVARAIITLRLGAHEALRLGGDVIPADIDPRGEGRLQLTTRVPKGPLLAISPFNFPLNLVAHKLSPAIAVGATVVLKPAPQCPLTAYALRDLLYEAGLPEGALTVVPCHPAVAEKLVRDDRLKMLSFTGSDVVGWHLKAIAGKKSVTLELGGNAACIVDESADLEVAASAIVMGAFAQSGQVCIKVQRVLAARSVAEALLEKLIAKSLALPAGDPMDPKTVVGPLIEHRHVTRITEWIDEARDGGAQVVLGGAITGNLMRPAILTATPESARLCQDEVFGPVLLVDAFDDFDEAIQRVNRSRFGLQAGVFTKDLGRAMRAYATLDVGGVIINDVPTFRLDNAPYGGVKDSGLGREGVASAVMDMTEPKLLVLR